MSAQPADAGYHRPTVRVPRTLRGVRAALPEDQRAAFAAELEDGNLTEVFETWWLRAVALTTPSVAEGFAQIKAGIWQGTPAAEVFGDRWTTA